MKTKNQVLSNLKAIRNDCQVVCDSLQDDNSYAEPWDFYEYSNWECMVELIDDAIEYIKKEKEND